MMKRTMAFAALIAVTTVAAAAERQTVIRERDGSTTTVRTDRQGTQVDRGGRTVYSAGGDRHNEQVDYSKRQGGTVQK